MSLIYTGVGSRETPKEVCEQIHNIAVKLAKAGFLLRSGGARGADTAFEKGCKSAEGAKEIYLPWKNFNGNPSRLYPSTKEAYDKAELFHPSWKSLIRDNKALMARNSHQVLGHELDRASDFIVCWTRYGEDGISKKTTILTGGTGQAIRIGAHYGIPIFNLAKPNAFGELMEFLKVNYPTLSFS